MPATDTITRSLIRKLPGGPFALRHPAPFQALLILDGLWLFFLGAALLYGDFYWGITLWLLTALMFWISTQVQSAERS